MTTYSQSQVEAFAAHAGFSNTTQVPGTGGMSQLEVITGIAYAESRFQSPIIGDKGNIHGQSYGILQINTFWLSHGITIAGAQNPQQAFNFAFNTISHHGTFYGDWTTFNNGAYKQLKQTGASSSRGIIHLPSNGWWHFSHPNDLGQPDRFGGFPKPDINVYGLPGNYPIATILSGTVTSTNAHDPWGGTVTIKLDSPINSLATHFAFLHLSQINTAPGKHVVPGDIIGHAGSRPLGSQNAALGVALYAGDAYGHDQWDKMTKKNLLGPLNVWNVIEAADKGTLTEGAGGVGGQSGGGNNGSGGSNGNGLLDLFTIQAGTPFLEQTSAKLANVQIGPDDNVATLLYTMDRLFDVYNPFNAFQGGNILSDVGNFLYATFVVDLTALAVRATIWAVGIYIIFKLFNNFINVTGALGGGLELAGRAASLAAMA